MPASPAPSGAWRMPPALTWPAAAAPSAPSAPASAAGSPTSFWAIVLAAAALLALTMGTRSSFGLFLSPMNTDTGAGLAVLGLAVALGQLGWGVAQPVAGWLATRRGVHQVVRAGALLGAAATAALAFSARAPEILMLMAAGGIAGAAAGGAPILLAAVAQRVDPARRGLASGVVGAGGSAGQLLIAPAAGLTIAFTDWRTALLVMAGLCLLAWPLTAPLRSRPAALQRPHNAQDPGQTLPLSGHAAGTAAASSDDPPTAAAPVTQAGASARDVPWRQAVRHPAYWLLAAGFFVCGFHVSFLTTHMPGVIESCGLPMALAGTWLGIIGLCNIAGSIVSGMLSQRLDMARMLMVLYAARGIGIALYLWAPKTEAVMLVFAVWMGLSYMATLPPTAGLTGRLFGTRQMAILLGGIMFVHQIGAFLGAWLGGLAVAGSGHYDAVWIADLSLAALAVALHAPLRRRARK